MPTYDVEVNYRVRHTVVADTAEEAIQKGMEADRGAGLLVGRWSAGARTVAMKERIRCGKCKTELPWNGKDATAKCPVCGTTWATYFTIEAKE